MTDPTDPTDNTVDSIANIVLTVRPGDVTDAYELAGSLAVALHDAGWLRTPDERARAARVRAHTGPDRNLR